LKDVFDKANQNEQNHLGIRWQRFSNIHRYICARETRFGEFSPIGRLVTLGCFLITELAHIFRIAFSTIKNMLKFWQTRGWATFGAFFPRKQIVTLTGPISSFTTTTTHHQKG
jgi:hypothetical protein